jgi:hypothetical protein
MTSILICAHVPPAQNIDPKKKIKKKLGQMQRTKSFPTLANTFMKGIFIFYRKQNEMASLKSHS